MCVHFLDLFLFSFILFLVGRVLEKRRRKQHCGYCGGGWWFLAGVALTLRWFMPAAEKADSTFCCRFLLP